jgi:hypothetical protein
MCFLNWNNHEYNYSSVGFTVSYDDGFGLKQLFSGLMSLTAATRGPTCIYVNNPVFVRPANPVNKKVSV